MQRLFARAIRRSWPLIAALALVLMPAGSARAQFMGYGGWGYPGWGYGGWGWGGYGYPNMNYSYGYPFYGLGNIPISGNFVMAGPGYGGGYGGYGGYGGFGGYGGYGGFGGYGGYGYGLMGLGYAPGGIGLSGVGYWNPMFGVGLTPLGNYSFMMETRLLGRVPRATGAYYGYGTAAYRGYGTAAYRGW